MNDPSFDSGFASALDDVVLVVNAGSSSIKFEVFSVRPELKSVARGAVEEVLGAATFVVGDQKTAMKAPGHAGAIDAVLEWVKGQGAYRLVGVGHRVVHGGTVYAAPIVITDEVVNGLTALVPLAPLHQPHNLAGIEAVRARYPSVPQVACFDTAFHTTNAPLEQRYAIPRALHDEGVRRYGFHGLSYEFIASDARASTGKVIVLHLGNGSSLCALRDGKSVATTMGFTALEGVPMGTRSGSIDPGVLLYLLQQKKLNAQQIETLLYKQSGLLGVSGLSSDMRTLLSSSDPHAAEAVELFCWRVAREIGSLAAALQGLDTLVFTAGIGEHADQVRAKITHAAAWLGVELDEAANQRGGPQISTPASRVKALVIATDEELMVARHTVAALQG